MVDLPAPLGPSSPKISPRRTSKLAPFTAMKEPKRRSRSRTSMTGGASDASGTGEAARVCEGQPGSGGAEAATNVSWGALTAGAGSSPVLGSCGSAANRARKPSSKPGFRGVRRPTVPASCPSPASKPQSVSARAASGVPVSRRTPPACNTASVTPGAASSRFWAARARMVGVTNQVRPASGRVKSPGAPSPTSRPWCMMATRSQCSASSR